MLVIDPGKLAGSVSVLRANNVRPYTFFFILPQSFSLYPKITKLCAPRDRVSLTISAWPMVY